MEAARSRVAPTPPLKTPRRVQDARRYALVLVSVGIATGVSLVLAHFHFRAPSAPLLLLAVAISSWFGGPGPAVLAVVLAILSFDWFFVQPAGRILMSPSQIPYFVVFAALASLISWFSTIRRRAEEALRTSEERFRTLVQFSFDVYWESDSQHRFTRQEFAYHVALAPARGSEIGKTRWEVPYLEPGEEAWRTHRATLDAHLPFRDFELARPTPDGGKRYVSVSGLPVFDSIGRFLGYRGVGRDITERKRAEAELRARQELLDLAQKAARAVAFDWYIGARESEHGWSPELEAMYGLEPGTFDGTYQGWKTLIHPDDWPAVQVAISRAKESGDVAAEYRVIHTDGTVHWLRAKGRMFFDAQGQPERMVGFMIDVTDWRHAEEALRASEARFRTFVDHATDGLFLHDDDLTVIDVNRHACEALGYSRDEMIGMHPRQFDAGLDERTLADLAERVRAGETVTFETRHRRKDGSEFPVEIRARQFHQGGGRLGLSFVRDISDRKRAEEERREHLWFLESMDRINRAIQGTNDLEKMMSDVLDAVLDVLACDRAWLIHPCDPAAPSWSPTMERTRPGFPGAFTAGAGFPVDADVAALFAAARASDRVVHFRRDSGRDAPAVAERFGIRSQIAMAVHPKTDEPPYLFGIQQCSHARVWTAPEQRLFQEIGRRLADALTTVLIFRSLRQSERMLEDAQRLAHVGYWDRDLVAHRVTLSDETYRIFGFEPAERVTDLTVWHERWQALIHPEDRPAVLAAVTAALGGGPRYDVEFRIVRNNGDVRVVHSQGDVIRDVSGQPSRMFGTQQDITELRQAENELRASEARFRMFVDHATDAFFRLDDSSTVIDVNRHACESLGYNPRRADRYASWSFRRRPGRLLTRSNHPPNQRRRHGDVRDAAPPQGRTRVPRRDPRAPVRAGWPAFPPLPRARHHRAQARRGSAARERRALPYLRRPRGGRLLHAGLGASNPHRRQPARLREPRVHA